MQLDHSGLSKQCGTSSRQASVASSSCRHAGIGVVADLHEGRYLEASPPMGLMLAQAPLPLVIFITLAVTSSSVVTITSSALQPVRCGCMHCQFLLGWA